MHTGYVAWPDCFSTFGLLGAVLSASIVHFASPLPVLVAVQPGGGAPTLRLSKLTESAAARTAINAATPRLASAMFFIGRSISSSKLVPECIFAFSSGAQKTVVALRKSVLP